MNVMNLVGQAAQMLGIDEQQAQQAAKKALPKMQQTKSKEDALNIIKDSGMDDAFFDRALSILDSPKAKQLSMLTSMFGIDIGEAKSKINELKGSASVSSQNQSVFNYKHTPNTKAQRDSLSSLKAGLQRRK